MSIATPSARGALSALPGREAVHRRPLEVAEDAWPHTARLLPWLLSGFLVVLWLVPIQDVLLPVRLPIDAKLDRLLLAGLAVVWLAAVLAGGRAAPRLRRSPLNVAVLGFAAVAFASVFLNLSPLANVGDLGLAVKKLGLLVAYVAFFYVAATSLRPAEVTALCTLMIGLASIAALGTIWEYRTGQNLFYEITSSVLPPGFSLLPETPDPRFGRPSVTGPTQHGLAMATMLALALPFAVVRIVQSASLRRKVLYAVATALILAGTMATLRKTAAVMPAAVIVVLLLYWRREMLRLAPLGLVGLLVVQALSPGALGSIRGQLEPDRLTSSASTEGRTEDYDAVVPDIKSHLALGRGYGTYDPDKYRILDNQYLMLLIEVGFVGFALYIAMALSVVLVSHGTIRRRDPIRGPPALACAAGSAAFLACSALFDVLAYAQLVYLFFFVAAVAVLCAATPSDQSRAEATAASWPPR